MTESVLTLIIFVWGLRPSLLSSILLHSLVEERVLFTSPTCSKQGQDDEDLKLYKGKQKVLVWLTAVEFLQAGVYTPYHLSLTLQIPAT